eukprot:16431319-Heterocapsa_arctica.AAC.1
MESPDLCGLGMLEFGGEMPDQGKHVPLRGKQRLPRPPGAEWPQMEIRPESMEAETETERDVRPEHSDREVRVEEEREAHRVFPENDGLEAATRDTLGELRQQEPPMAQDGEQME